MQATNYTELNKNCSVAIQELDAALTAFSSTFKNLPVGELTKNKRLHKSVKEKAAWYACIVNPNIDILLLQEFFDAKQTRNILLKKETDQYQQTLHHFVELRTLGTNASIFENLLGEKSEEVNSFDLFSSPVINKIQCPLALQKLFAQWQLKPLGEVPLETLLYQFYDWHTLNNFSFTGQRQFILWFNYQLWKLYGEAASLLNVEHYFYHHWNKESRNAEYGIKQLISFMQEACHNLEQELKIIYRTDIKYETLEPNQKIANNYLYHAGFNCDGIVINSEDYSIQLNKILCKRGFVGTEDITAKMQLEKVKLTLQNWYKTGLVDVVFNENNWYAYLIPGENKSNRLQNYCNVTLSITEPNWNQIFNKPLIPMKKPIEMPTESQTVPVKRVSGQKAFFG